MLVFCRHINGDFERLAWVLPLIVYVKALETGWSLSLFQKTFRKVQELKMGYGGRKNICVRPGNSLFLHYQSPNVFDKCLNDAKFVK